LPYSEENSEPSAFRAYWALTQDGGSKHFMPTFNQDPVSREPDVKGDAWGLVPMSPEQPNSTRRGLPHAVEDERDYLTDQAYAYPPEAGLSDYFEQNPTYEATVKSYDWDLDIHIMDTAPVPHTARETLDAKIMTMEQWHDAGKPVGEIWVLDTDGWAYWASALEPGDATGLLLNEMTYISPAIGTIYYAIYADAQMATLGSWELAFDGLTDEAEDLMNTIANPAYEITLSENGIVSFPDGLALHTESADKVITVMNTGNSPTGELSIELGGANPESFVLNTTSLPNLEVGETAEFALHSRDGLSVGTHTATVTVSGDTNITVKSFNVSIVVKEGIALMREGLVGSTFEPTDTFLTFPKLQRQQVAQVKVIDLHIPNMNTFAAGTYDGKKVIAAVDLTHASSDYPVVAFYTESGTSGRSDVYIAGHRGVAATGDLTGFFMSLTNATSIDVKLLDTSRVTSMWAMFYNTSSLATLDVSKFDTSCVTNMQSMFWGASSLTSLNLSGWNTSSVTDMSYVFLGASSLTTLNLSGFDTSNVTTMFAMFYGASSLSSLDLSGFNTSHVTSMAYMFHGTSSLTKLDLSGFNTSNVTNMHAMFYCTISLTTVGNISGWNTSRVTDMSYMFYAANSLKSLNLSGWNTSRVTNMGYMFYHAVALTTLDLSGWNTSSVTDMTYMFAETHSLVALDLSRWNTSKVTDMSVMFYGASSLTTLNLSGWDTSRVTDMSYMFTQTPSLTNLDFRKATFGRVTDNAGMFWSSGINKITVGSPAAENFIQNAPGWARNPPRTIERV